MRAAYRWIAALLLALVVFSLGAWLLTKTERYRSWVMAKERTLWRHGDPEIEKLPSMIWAHRGLRGPNAPPNSPEAMRAASEAGFSGVELDLRCRDGALVVAHYADEPGQPFTTVVASVGPEQYLWLDFKELSEAVARACAPSLRRELPLALHRRTFIESSSLAALAVLRSAIPGTRAIYSTRSWQRDRFSLGYLSLLFAIEQHAIAALGFPAGELSAEVAQALAGLGLFTFTTNNVQKLRQQRALDVDVILTDRLPPETR